jgi:PAS domain S-box-containing protein
VTHGQDLDPTREPQRLAGLMEDAPVFLAILAGPEHTFVSANRNYRTLIGGRDPVGKAVRAALPELIGQGFYELLDRVYTTGEPFIGTELPIGIARGDAGELDEAYLSFVYQPTHDAAGAIDGILVTGYEVTEQVRARTAAQAAAAAAERERAYFAAVLEQLPVGVIIATVPEGRIRHFNARAEALLGHPLIPIDRLESYAEYGAIHPDGTPYQPEEHPMVRAVLHGETILEEETLYRRGDGQIISLSVNVAPVRDADGAMTTAVAAFSDLTPLKELERTRETFLAAVAHDLKTPLTSIRGLAQLLQRGVERGRLPDATTLATRLGQIVAATGRANALVEEQLDLARVRAGQALMMERHPADLATIVRRVVEEQQTTDGRLRLELGAPALPGQFDQLRLERALGNLIANALKYSPGGEPVLVQLVVEGPEATGAVAATVTIADRGVGIPTEDMPHLGEHFYRGGNVVGRIGGTGLGLASAREIVAAHGGTLVITSAEGTGTTVTVRLPLDTPAGTSPTTT